MDILYNDGYNHFYTVYVLNTEELPSGRSTGTFRNLENPKNGPARILRDNVLEIAANIYKPIYVWVYKKGKLRYYPYKPATVGDSLFHPDFNPPKAAHMASNTGESCGINVTIGDNTYYLYFGTSQLTSMENPDHDDRVVDGTVISIPNTIITINQCSMSMKAPINSFGIGVSFYTNHRSPVRDPDKYIHY